MPTLTRADLSDKVHLKIGLPYTESAQVVDNVIDITRKSKNSHVYVE